MHEILTAKHRKKYATDAGTTMHKKLQQIIIDNDIEHGDIDLINKIKSNKLEIYFSKNARAEVPIAGYINKNFISRRIDRMVAFDNKLYFIDYKTDTDTFRFRDKYIAQIREYATLLRIVYPNHIIRGFILWTHDFTLEEIK
jgi:ATP-dependent exoDNAse (exonuclease V) beta subunit